MFAQILLNPHLKTKKKLKVAYFCARESDGFELFSSYMIANEVDVASNLKQRKKLIAHYQIIFLSIRY